MVMKLMTKHLRNYAAKMLQAADLLDDLDDLGTIPEVPAKPTRTTTDRPPRKPLSHAARNRIAKAQRKRWRLYHGGKRAA